ncbi:inner centromere protein-like [Phymastichus coffea]|uniref:inner centromere protein-like n=1 Tax=Phymastichus coffea TaxID=108790 RepID=UPI00273B47AE|nr:inner centromere protein-like [Phymastichus coffea]
MSRVKLATSMLASCTGGRSRRRTAPQMKTQYGSRCPRGLPKSLGRAGRVARVPAHRSPDADSTVRSGETHPPANHTELAYRKAVAKLKQLLAESCTPPSGAADDREQAPRAVLRSLVARHGDHVEQLEQESRYCRYELCGLVQQMRKAAAENEALQRSGAPAPRASQLELERLHEELGRRRDEHRHAERRFDQQLKRLGEELRRQTGQLREQLSLTAAQAEAAREQLAGLRLAGEEDERRARRLQAELDSSRARLQRAEAAVLQARCEQARLGERAATLEKRLSVQEIVQQTRVGATRPSDIDKKSTSLICNLESKPATSGEVIDEQHDNELANDSAVLVSSKKRRVKVDLKVKVIPKRKSTQSEPPFKAKNAQSTE